MPALVHDEAFHLPGRHNQQDHAGGRRRKATSPRRLDASRLTEAGIWDDDHPRLLELTQHAADAGFTKIGPLPPNSPLNTLAAVNQEHPNTLLLGSQDAWDVADQMGVHHMMQDAEYDLERYVVMHEAGHRVSALKYGYGLSELAGTEEVLMTALGRVRPRAKMMPAWSPEVTLLAEDAGMSDYGLSNAPEAYGEMHAAFQMGSQNELVLAYADVENWDVMPDTTLAAAGVLRFHLPGKHDQQSHAGGRSRKRARLAPLDTGAVTETSESGWKEGDPVLDQLAQEASEQGFTELGYDEIGGAFAAVDAQDPHRLLVGKKETYDSFYEGMRQNHDVANLIMSQMMPEAREAFDRGNFPEYVTTHEAGHTRAYEKWGDQADFETDYLANRVIGDDLLTLSGNRKMQELGMSAYGARVASEAYAEAWVGFQLGSDAPIVEAYAAIEEWER